MTKQPPWEITVGRKGNIIAEFQVPSHKLQKNALAAFLRALVARYRSSSPEEMLSYYVNNTRGAPARLPFAEIVPCHDLERLRVGLQCGGWECYATALHEVSSDVAKSLDEMFSQNKASSRSDTVDVG